MFINACTIILTILCESIASYDKEFTPNVGTVLFTASDIKKKQWAKADIGLLRARKYFQSMLPPPVFINTFNEDYINILLGYFRDAYADIKRAAPDAETDIILTSALSDAIGGYLKVWVLPVAKLDFYGGTVSQDNVVKLFQFHNEIKRYLDTDGKGWRQPDENVLNSITINVAPLKLASNTRSMKNPCDLLAYFEKTNSGLSIPMPTVHWNDKSSTMFVPLKNVSLIMMNTPDSSQNLMKYYVAARSCIQASNPKEQDRFDEKFQNWLVNDVVPHLKDENLYLALGSVLALVNKTRDLCNNVLDLYNGSGNRLNVVNVTPAIPVDLTSKKMWIISIILIIEIAWCIPALIYILRARKAHKKDCSSNVYLYIDNNKPNKNGFYKTKTNLIEEGTCPATVNLKNFPRTCGNTEVKLFRKSQQSNVEVTQCPSSMVTNTAATDTRSFFSSKDQSASAIKAYTPAKNSDNTVPRKSILKKISSHNNHSNHTNSTHLLGLSSQEPLICMGEQSPTNSYTTTTTIQHCSRNASPLSTDISNCTRSRKQKPPKRDKLEENRVSEERIAECKKLEERKKAEEYRKWEERKRVEDYERRMIEECRKFEERRKAELYRKAEDSSKSSERRRAEECRKAEDSKKLVECRKTEEFRDPENCRKMAEHRKAEEYREAEDCRKTAEHRRAEECREAEDYKMMAERRRAETCREAEDYRKSVECRNAEEYKEAEDCRKTAEHRRADECREAENCRKTADRRRAEACREAEDYRKSVECRNADEYKEAEDCRKTAEHRRADECREAENCRKTADRRRAEACREAEDYRKSVECRNAEEYKEAEDCRKTAEHRRAEECREAEDCRKTAERRRTEACREAEDYRKSVECRKAEKYREADDRRKMAEHKIAEEYKKGDDRRKSVECQKAEECRKAEDSRKAAERRTAEEFKKAEDCRKAAERRTAEECKKAEDYRKVAERRKAEECTKVEDCRKSLERRKSGEGKKKDEFIKFEVPKQADECRKFKDHKTDAGIKEHKKSEEYSPERKGSQIMECTIKASKYEIIESKNCEVIDAKHPSCLRICKNEQSDNEESGKYDSGNKMEEFPTTEGRASPCEGVCSCSPCLKRSYILSHSELTAPENTTENISSLKQDKQVETKTTRFQVTKEFITRPVGEKVGTGKPYLEIIIDRPAADVCVDVSQCRDQPLTFKPSKIPKPKGPCNVHTPATFSAAITSKYCPHSEKYKSMIPQRKKKTVDDIDVTPRRKCTFATPSNDKLNETL